MTSTTINKKRLILLSFFQLCFFVVLTAQSFSLISWNIQDFGKTKDDSEIKAIANILRGFDIVAIQEVVAIDPGGAKAVAKLADQLNRMGAKWDYRISDPTESPGKKMERYAYLWKTSKVKLMGRPWLDKEDEPIIFREPYLARFQIDGKKILLANYHSRTHDENPAEEIVCFRNYYQRFPGERIIIAGDFNTYPDADVLQSLRHSGFQSVLIYQKTTLKRKCGKKGAYLNHPIDHVFFNYFSFELLESGVVDFVKNCQRLDSARNLSDHLPVWARFRIAS